MADTSVDVETQLAELLSDVRSETDISRKRRIYCNRNLRLSSIELIGFDMDYTLALYHQDRLEKLSIDLTLEKMIQNHGFPPEIRKLRYDPAWAIRGLVVDRELGNVFKMDRHAYVGRVYHGFRPLTRDERGAAYRRGRINLSEDRYVWIDTLFGLPEAVMYITLVDYYDRQPSRPGYAQLYDAIRASIDEAHADESLKTVIKADLPSYIVKDDRLAETLHKLRSSGKRLFVLTNSYFDYTSAVMSYLLDGVRNAYPSWRNYFDVVIVGGKKPRFFTQPQPFLQLDATTGEVISDKVTKLSRDYVYQGGNITAFENMTNVRGERCLYVGDHIYGDILKLKKAHMWRTALVLQELEVENSVGERHDGAIRDLRLLDRRRRNIESEIDYQVLRLKRLQKLIDERAVADELRPRLEEARGQAKAALDSLRDRSRLMREEVASLEDTVDRAYNPNWGSMLREGNENSRFGEQVNDYADLYTSRASNFLSYSPLRYFRSPRRLMPHEISGG